MSPLTLALDILIWGVIAIVAIAHAFEVRTAPPRDQDLEP